MERRGREEEMAEGRGLEEWARHRHLCEGARAVLAVLVVEADAREVAMQRELLASIPHALEDVLVLAPRCSHERERGENQKRRRLQLLTSPNQKKR